MSGMEESRKLFIANLADRNREFYGTQDGRGTLRTLKLGFEHTWTYVFELVQNALDAGAQSIAVRTTENGNAFVFQHDGNVPLEEKNVKALSKVFRSTKGAASVGFMGIGFKSVFGRFQEARISGWGWTFSYAVTQTIGKEYGDRQTDLLGAVVPVWNDTVEAPETGFTTRFEFCRLTDETANLQADLERFLPTDDLTLLPILAAAGLTRLQVNDQIWEFGISEELDGSLEATALSLGEKRLWQVFPVEFKPSTDAIRRFLEHREIQPSDNESEHVYKEAARSRRVFGVLPLDNDGLPAPPLRGRVYATLPTDVTVPFGIHINGDWLLNMGRTDLREIEDNAWQHDVADRIADVLASLLNWAARKFAGKPDSAKKIFGALPLPSSEAGGLEAHLTKERWLSRLRDLLKDAEVIPVWTEATRCPAFAKPDDSLVPPQPLANAFSERPEFRASTLLEAPVVMRHLLEPGGFALLKEIGLLNEMGPSDLEPAWQDGLENWWNTLPQENGIPRRLLFRLWAAMSELTSECSWAGCGTPLYPVGYRKMAVGRKDRIL